MSVRPSHQGQGQGHETLKVRNSYIFMLIFTLFRAPISSAI